MNIGQTLMRLLSPICERQRMEFRHSMAQATAHAEDLTRTLRLPQTVEALRTGNLKGPA